MPSVAADDVAAALRAIEDDGYVVLENAISSDTAGELAESVLQAPDRTAGVKGYFFTANLLNHDRGFVDLILHPSVLAIARHLLGGRTVEAPNAFAWPEADQVRLGTIDGLVAGPGCEPGWWHQDSPMGQLNPARPLPDFPIVVNFLWMLTPFTERTGATRVKPHSQHCRKLPSPSQQKLDDQVLCCGEPGSVVVIPNTVWHASSGNQSNEPRVAAACFYQPWWTGRFHKDVYPVRKEIWQTLPPDAQALTKHHLDWNTDYHGDLL